MANVLAIIGGGVMDESTSQIPAARTPSTLTNATAPVGVRSIGAVWRGSMAVAVDMGESYLMKRFLLRCNNIGRLEHRLRGTSTDVARRCAPDRSNEACESRQSNGCNCLGHVA
jgi:hypothetical protein